MSPPAARRSTLPWFAPCGAELLRTTEGSRRVLFPGLTKAFLSEVRKQTDEGAPGDNQWNPVLRGPLQWHDNQ